MAQTPTTATLPPVTITGSSDVRAADVAGFGSVPLAELPASATVLSASTLREAGVRRLADVTQFDPAVTDAYNAPGYIDYLTIRGFLLDNRFNYRREGLPFSAETSVPLENKEQIEILKGTSGIQAGTSAPGGLVNYRVKRPTDGDVRALRVEATQRSSLLTAADLGGRFGAEDAFGWRLNLAHERVRPLLRNLDGERDLAALATDWHIGAGHLLEAEVEWSRKRQPSQQAFSLVGNTLPAPPDGRLNLNNQPWSLPSVFGALTGTVRYSRTFDGGWRWTTTAGQQRLRTDDRLAYAYGCGAEGHYDRFCSDGTFDAYDFRSDDERRRQAAARTEIAGTLQTGGVRHTLAADLQWNRVKNRFNTGAFNYVGTGNVQGTAFTPSDPAPTDPGTQRDERALELGLRDRVRWNDAFSTWFGVRHTRLQRDSVRTDGSRPTGYRDSVTTPWAAASYTWAPGQQVYASWGQGAESQVVPNRSALYTNAGSALPVLKSRQVELGTKGGAGAFDWSLAAFRITRPVSDVDTCATPCTAGIDGAQRHQGVEGSVAWRGDRWSVDAGVMWLDAERSGSAQAALNGRRPTNVPEWTARARATWQVPGVAGLAVRGALVHEGSRNVLPDGSITLPAWTRIDAGLRYASRIGGAEATWSVNVDNLADRRYWRESPYQFGHVYLYRGAPRTLRAGVEIAL